MATSKEEVKERNKKDKRLDKVKNPEKLIKTKKKRKIVILMTLLIIMIIVAFFSFIFALVQNGKNTIVKGVCVKRVELSDLTVSDAKEKIMKEVNKELKTPIKLIYEDYSFEINLSEIEFSYKVDETLKEAYNIGRDENILKSNYDILASMISGKSFDLKYSINENLLENIIKNIDTEIPGKVSEATYDIEEKELIITSGKDGIAVDKDKLKNIIIKSIIDRDETIENKEYQEIKIPVINKKADEIDVQKIYNEVYCEPKDAYLIKEPFQLVKDVSGIDFAISIEDAKKLITGDKEEYIIPLKITPASKTIADLGDEAFPHTLSVFKTNYNAGDTSRTTNLRIAANKVNGTVLLPGEEFSFNKVVGKRTVQEGYQNAAIYENGKVVDGLAGGICQISSTLYNAVLFANLEVVSRRNHNFTSTYVPAGRDATVVYGSIDFVFKNSRQYPIKLVSSVSGGVATFEIKGIKEDTEYEVKLYSSTTGQTPFEEEVIEDSSVPAGTKQVVQGGHNGLKVSTYKALVLNGKEVSRELITSDTYKVMNRIVKVPVGTVQTSEPVATESVPSVSEPVAQPTPTPTPTPETTPEPTIVPTPEPSVEPTPEATPEPKPEVVPEATPQQVTEPTPQPSEEVSNQ